MSHFTMLVIGDNVKDQLAPFDETIKYPEYKVGRVVKKDKDDMVKYYKKNKGFTGTFDECYSKFGDDWNGGHYKKNEKGVWYEYSTYNPKSKWDWVSVGGRWTGFFKLKDGAQGEVGEPGIMTEEAKPGYADSAYKKDIDFEKMREESGINAGELYDKVFDVIKDTPVPETWKSVLKRFDNKEFESIDDARDFYLSQERIAKVDLNSSKIGYINCENFSVSREEYVQNARNNAISTFGVVKNGEWFEKGSMGWWGIATNEMEQEEWGKKFNELIDGLPDDTLLTVVDCHI